MNLGGSQPQLCLVGVVGLMSTAERLLGPIALHFRSRRNSISPSTDRLPRLAIVQLEEFPDLQRGWRLSPTT